MARRTYNEIRNSILSSLKEKVMTPTQLALTLNLDYRTIQRHLIWLKGTDKIKIVRKTGRKFYYKLRT